MHKNLTRIAALSLLAGASFLPSLHTPAQAQSAAARPQWGSFGVDYEAMDRSVRPGDDFWMHMNGNWARTVEIPADQGLFSQVQRLNELSYSQVNAIIQESAARRDSLTGDDLRVADYYSSLMDQAAIDARGVDPLIAELAPALSAENHAQLAAAMGHLLRGWSPTPPLGRMPRYYPALFALDIDADSRAPESYVLSLYQNGTGLPNRDYYLNTDEDSVRVQQAYRDHLATMLRLMNVPQNEASARAQAVYDFEARIAEAQWPLADSRDSEKTYNPRTLSEIEAEAPGFDWRAFLSAAGLAERPRYIVAQPSAFAGMASVFGQTPLSVLKDWLSIRVAKDRALVLPSAFAEAEFAFSNGILGGADEAPARWLQVVELTAAAMTDAVSRPYIERHFPPETKAAMDDLVRNLLRAMDMRLANLSWMTPETREKARAKLASFTPMIGYPDRWRSYEGLTVIPGDAYGNFIRAGQFRYDRDRARIDDPVDKAEWWMMPITANAYASFATNSIVFPAAYLQPPHFDLHADPAVNYGAIGFVIGHEISHHFDDQGSKYDPSGRLNMWWTEEDLAQFNQRTARLVAQFDSYEPLPGHPIRGAQTLGENIADNAGLAIAYDAYRLSLNGREPPVIDGFTGDQRFFMGRAQVNRVKYRDEALRQQIIAGVHSPAPWRTYSVRNHDVWYDAFDVTPDHRHYIAPEDRVKVWE